MSMMKKMEMEIGMEMKVRMRVKTKMETRRDLRSQVRQSSSKSYSLQTEGGVQLHSAYLPTDLLNVVTFQLLSEFWGIVWAVV